MRDADRWTAWRG